VVLEGLRGRGRARTEVLDRPLARHDGLHEEAEHGEHGQAAILDLLHLQLREGVRVVRQAQRVERLALPVPALLRPPPPWADSVGMLRRPHVAQAGSRHG
jgi:hypothetical protein